MIEINAASGLIGKEGAQAARSPSQGSFRNFLESLGVVSDRREPIATDRPKEPSARSLADRPLPDHSMAHGSDRKGIQETHSAKVHRESARTQSRTASEADEPCGIEPDQECRTAAGPENDGAKVASRKVSDSGKAEVDAVIDEELAEDEDKPDWQAEVGQMLGLLGIDVDPQKLALLSTQEMRELDIALRAGLKGMSEGQPMAQVARLVGELLPISLQTPDAIGFEAAPVKENRPVELLGDDPVREHMATEIGRLAEAMVELTKPAKSDEGKAVVSKGLAAAGVLDFASSMEPLVAEDAPVMPVAQAQKSAPVDGFAAALTTTAPTIARKEDPSAFLRMDANAYQIQRSDLRDAEAAEVKAPSHFRPSGPAGEILAHQVYDEFQLRPGMDHREMVLKLWPRELGQVSVHIRMGENDRVEAKILVQNENIRQALLEHTPVLRETLAKQGLDLGNLSVSVGGGNTPSQQDARDQSRRHRSGRGWENGVLETTAMVEAGSDTGRRNGFNSIDVLT
ncbi:MAG: hypothetical protein RL318_559 [Fibrobacterota bacterium]|jgi:hypothetical protein